MRYRRIDLKTVGIFTLAAALFFLGGVLLFSGNKKEKEEKEKVSLKEECSAYLSYLIRREIFPFLSVSVYKEGAGEFDEDLLEDLSLEGEEGGMAENFFAALDKKWDKNSNENISKNSDKNLYKNGDKNSEKKRDNNQDIKNETNDAKEDIFYKMQQENLISKKEDHTQGMLNENNQVIFFVENKDFLNAGSGFVGDTQTTFRMHRFVKNEEKKVSFTESERNDPEFIRKHFYTVDARAELREEFLNPEVLWNYDLKVDKASEGPQILIYHTHSQEGFADSTPGNRKETIYGVGERLTEILSEQYGYSVYHHSGEYDVKDRDRAYSESAPALEAILEQYPQIQVVIDLHRDGVSEERHLVQDLEGEGYAQVMFFNGVSCLRQGGEVARLPNENLTGNLASSLRATALGMEYYPGVFRKNYINAYRYNMQYREKSFLIEIGAQTNTLEEALNACEPLAHVLDMVFTGAEI